MINANSFQQRETLMPLKPSTYGPAVEVFWREPTDSLLRSLDTQRCGLRQQQAEKRLARIGPNLAGPSRTRSILQKIVHRLVNPLIAIPKGLGDHDTRAGHRGRRCTVDDGRRTNGKNNVKRLPVVRGGKPVGMITRRNLLRAVASLARDVPAPTVNDDQIRRRILDEIERNAWCPLGLSVIVRDGIVHLSGVITESRFR